MMIRLTKRWNGFRAGREISPGDGVANMLIKRGFAVPVIEEARTAGPAERATGYRQKFSKGK